MIMIKDDNIAFATGLYKYINQELSSLIEFNRRSEREIVDLCFLAIESSIDFFLPYRL